MKAVRSLTADPTGQSGSALVVTLLVMVSLTILGIMSINTAVVEIQIGSNEKQLRHAFYLAEAGVMEGVQRLAAMADKDLDEQIAVWHHPVSEIEAKRMDFRDPEIWDADGQGEDNALASAVSEQTYIAAVEWDVATGGSLIHSDSRLYLNRVYGLCELYNADHLIEVGYAMRY